ncbi:hypothetical protein EJ04DRAFT_437539, partial [Polyplosphaeria fusca]
DKEKGKYFAIQTGSSAPNTNSKYTKYNINKEQRRLKKEAAASISKTRRKRIVRRDISTNHRHLHREIGNNTGLRFLQDAWPAAFATGCAPSLKVRHLNIRYFDHDPTTDSLYVTQGRAAWQLKAHRGPGIDGSEDAVSFDDSPLPLLAPIAQLTSDISSLHYLPGSGAMVMTSIGGDRPPLVYLADPGKDGPCIGEQLTHFPATAIWGSAPLPSFSESINTVSSKSTETVAVAASKHVLFVTRSEGATWQPKVFKGLSTDVLALEWSSPNELYVGQRSGDVHILDTREERMSAVLRHSTPVTHLRRVSSGQLVCKGLQDTLMLYDIRMAKAQRSHESPKLHEPYEPGEQWSSHSKRRKARKAGQYRSASHNISPTTPLLVFPYSNADDTELGMAVHPRLGLVAAVDDDGNILLWSLRNGDIVKDFKPSPVGYGPLQRIRCMKFIEDDGERAGPSLWSVWEGGITRFGW